MDAEGPFTPSFDKAEVARIKAWHEAAYVEMKHEAGSGGQYFEYLGLQLFVPPMVHPITGVSDLLGQAVLAQTKPTDRVLDMGTGCGVNAILAATRGARVVAADINADAADATRANAIRNGVADRIEARVSDVFSAVPESFDLIVFDPPFRWFPPRDALEAGITDENYGALRTFFERVRVHLNSTGRILIFFGTSGDLTYLRSLIAASSLTPEVLNERVISRDDLEIGYVTLLLTAPL